MMDIVNTGSNKLCEEVCKKWGGVRISDNFCKFAAAKLEKRTESFVFNMQNRTKQHLYWEKTLIFFDEVDAYVHQKMMQLVNLYLLVGGMPAAVQTYLDTNDMQKVPLEVKSGKDYARHVALNNVMKNAEYGINEAIVLCNDNLSIRGNVTYAPIYMLMFIEKVKNEGPKIFKLDLGGLV